MDVLGLVALCIVAAEWMGLGWLSGVDWPTPKFWAPRWAIRLLVGSCLTGFAQLVLAAIGFGFASIPLVIASAAVGAGNQRPWTGKSAPAGCCSGWC